MESIGGYFGLELFPEKEYHNNAIRLNTARNALEYILKAHSYKKLYLPYYICDVVLQPVEKLKVDYEFYDIDINFEPAFDFGSMQKNEAFLYVNYFGFKDIFVKKINKDCKNLIIDNSQAFYSKPVSKVDTIYSARKFFGVPDGAYLYASKKLGKILNKDISYKRFQHLLKRADTGAEDGFKDFRQNEASLDNLEILEMSNLTHQLLKSINYKKVGEKRQENYYLVKKELDKYNQLNTDIHQNQIPFVYPLLTEKHTIRKTLIEKKIYVGQYWPNVLSWAKKNSLEFKLANNLINIPIDQRYSKTEMLKMIKIVKKELDKE